MEHQTDQKAMQQWVVVASWGLAVLVCFVAVLAWGQGLHWRFTRFSSYKLFPLLGLVAFSLMWTHYMAGGMRRLAGLPKSSIKPFLQITGWIVLVLIVLHPGLLVWQLFRDGFGLPPQSYLRNYVAPHMEWAALLGTLSLGVFLAYETKRFFGSKSWWKYVTYAGDAAMIGILIHSLRLGRNLQTGWLRGVWLFYGLLYVLVLVYIYIHDQSVNSQK